MTNSEYVDHFVGLLKAAKSEVPDLRSHVERCVQLGLDAFWGAWPWYFKVKGTTLTLTTNDTPVSLPSDFESFKTFREEGTARGLVLKYYGYDDFRVLVPKLSATSGNSPTIFTVYQDGSTKYAMFAPSPASSQTIYATYLTSAATCDLVPNRFQSGLEAFIAKAVCPYGTKERWSARQEAAAELKRLQTLNHPDASESATMPDQTDEPIASGRNYLGPWD